MRSRCGEGLSGTAGRATELLGASQRAGGDSERCRGRRAAGRGNDGAGRADGVTLGPEHDWAVRSEVREGAWVRHWQPCCALLRLAPHALPAPLIAARCNPGKPCQRIAHTASGTAQVPCPLAVQSAPPQGQGLPARIQREQSCDCCPVPRAQLTRYVGRPPPPAPPPPPPAGAMPGRACMPHVHSLPAVDGAAAPRAMGAVKKGSTKSETWHLMTCGA